jgi:outer membrane protein assembly factor BamB
VAETVIELDVSSPWEPPEPARAPLRFRPAARWVAAGTVLAVVLGLLVAAGAKPRTAALYRIDGRVLNVTVAGDTLLVGRFRQDVTEPVIEGRRLSDGKLLWTAPTVLQQHSAALSAGALILVRHTNDDSGHVSTIAAVDLATGRELWTRQGVALIGVHDDRVLIQELPEQARPVEVIEEEAAEPVDVDQSVNDAGPPQPRHLFALDERTGDPVWDLVAPPGTALTYTWEARHATGRVTAVDQLDGSGLLTRRDVRTGAVVATRQLEWSGTPAWFSTGEARPADPQPGRLGGRVVVYPHGQRGGLVFDLADGRKLFSTDRAIFDGLYECSAGLFCAVTLNGIATYDSTTGAPRWRLGRYTEVIATAGDRLVVGAFDRETAQEDLLGIADARTGAALAELTGWQLITGVAGDRILLWRRVDHRTALLGRLDPATGWITVFGRDGDWYGPPECSAGADMLACVMVGQLTVWRLPAARR